MRAVFYENDTHKIKDMQMDQAVCIQNSKSGFR